MAELAVLFAGTGASGPGSPTTANWANGPNVIACDNTYTTVDLTTNRPASTNLAASEYDISALNHSAQLTGIEVHIQAFLDQETASINEVYLRRHSFRTGVIKGPTSLSVSEIDYQFGGEGDLWDSSFKTVGDFLGVATGIVITAALTESSTTVTVSVDCITLTCYFINSRPFIMRFGLAPRRATLPVNRNQRSRI